MSGFIGALRQWLYDRSAIAPSARRDAVELIGKSSSGQLRRLADEELAALVGTLLASREYRTALRGNVRFLDSVSKQYAKKRSFSLKQRYALYNILERAYPHNLAAELRNLRS